MSFHPFTDEKMKSEFNAIAVENSLRSLARMLARQAAECDYKEHIQNITEPK